ncbi:MAG: glycosyltransferase family 4 protein [Patescibacteria group bacterium]|jgi:glycosyltransferase involved in cell wall biosynthesis|nr:glycosyltransferase family 4 protein [Patescibacteria group bacterium]
MKLVIAAEIFPPDIGGPATYSQRLAQALIARGWQVELICYSDARHQNDEPYIHRIIRSKFKPLHYFNYYRQLKTLAKAADVIYAMGPVGSGQPAGKVAKELKKKLVIKVVGDYAWESARNSGQTKLSIDDFQTKEFAGKIGLLQKTERLVCQAADKVITPSQYLKHIVKAWGVAENKIEVVYNSFEINTAASSSIDTKNLISAGRLVPWKGFETLIKLMPELDPAFKLTIFGQGPDYDNLFSLVNKLSLADRVELVGQVTSQELVSEMSKGIFILNTGYEGLSHTVLEAMAASSPVITTRIGGNPELITDGVNGLLVEYNNQEQLREAIIKLDTNPELVKQFVAESKNILEKFSEQKMIEETIRVLQS